MKRFTVYGHAFIPVKVKIVVKAKSQESALAVARSKLHKNIQPHIVPGTEDEASAWGFDPVDVEEIT